MTSTQPPSRATATGARLMAVIVLCPVLAVVWRSAVLFQQDLAFTAVETEVSFWGRGEYRPTPQTRRESEAAVNGLLAAAPTQPDYLELAASLYAWQGYWVEDPTREVEYGNRAVQAQSAAQSSRPAYRPGWELLETYARRVGDRARGDLARERLNALTSGSSAGHPEDPTS